MPPPGPPPPSPPPDGASGLSLSWATYVGGPGDDHAREALALPDGRVAFTARPNAAGMPSPAGFDPTFNGDRDTWVGILSADGRSLDAGTHVGGSEAETVGLGLRLAPDGDLLVTAFTRSPNLPRTAGRYQPTYPASGDDDGLLCRLSPDLSALRWCTYLAMRPRGGIDVASDGRIAVLGSSNSATAGAWGVSISGPSDVPFLVLDGDGTARLASRVFGSANHTIPEAGLSVRWAPEGVSVSGIARGSDFPVTGGPSFAGGDTDTFHGVIRADGSVASMALFGGSGGDLNEHGQALVDSDAILVGVTRSPSLPGMVNGPLGGGDGYVARVERMGPAVRWSRYLGGAADEFATGVATDAAGRIYVLGSTRSSDFPVTADAFQTRLAGGADAFLLVLSADGSEILYGSHFGGSGDDTSWAVAFAPGGVVYVVGNTRSGDFPVTSEAYQRSLRGVSDPFILRLEWSGDG